MNGVSIPSPVLASIRAEAIAAYPEECCGLLLASDRAEDPYERRVVDAAPRANRAPGERGRRFVIPAGELRAAEESATRAGQVVCGFYHSHPDHPARPSEFDRDHAWPWYTYLVVAVDRGPAVGPVAAFELDPERREFFEVPLWVAPPATAERGTG